MIPTPLPALNESRETLLPGRPRLLAYHPPTPTFKTTPPLEIPDTIGVMLYNLANVWLIADDLFNLPLSKHQVGKLTNIPPAGYNHPHSGPRRFTPTFVETANGSSPYECPNHLYLLDNRE